MCYNLFIMQNKLLFLLPTTFFILSQAIAETNQANTCQAVILCKSGDTSKQTYTAYLENQKAYTCYYKSGDTAMAKIAGEAMTTCQTMYGSINPILRKE